MTECSRSSWKVTLQAALNVHPCQHVEASLTSPSHSCRCEKCWTLKFSFLTLNWLLLSDVLSWFALCLDLHSSKTVDLINFVHQFPLRHIDFCHCFGWCCPAFKVGLLGRFCLVLQFQWLSSFRLLAMVSAYAVPLHFLLSNFQSNDYRLSLTPALP